MQRLDRSSCTSTHELMPPPATPPASEQATSSANTEHQHPQTGCRAHALRSSRRAWMTRVRYSPYASASGSIVLSGCVSQST